MSYLRTWDWPKLLDEYQRVCKPGGVIRITEGDILGSSSPAQMQISALALEAFYLAGHFVNQTRSSPMDQLPVFMQQQGVLNVQTRAHVLQYRAGTPEWQNFYDDMKYVGRTVLPFLRRRIQVPDNYEEIYQQSLDEMQRPDFVATWNLLTAWGAPSHYSASSHFVRE
ncbi:MAG TPA: hypothetical protein VKR06_17295 [Ktedonosporobacter sp.]|nr:hypothetical protein [Ktedonosporobacter sp.]